MTKVVFADLGAMPISNNFLRADQLDKPEAHYPLRASLDKETRLVQLDFPLHREAIFNEEYPYSSSQSSTWLRHAEDYADEMIERFAPRSVIEVGSNDGYLLQFFKEKCVRVCGIEPCSSVAEIARAKGITTFNCFFGREMSQALIESDLMVANNVLAHVPDIDDFVAGFHEALAPQGVATFEFPHLLNLIQKNQFDTIYHEHYSYLSFMAVQRVLARHRLRVFDVQELPTHGGSLRVFACHDKANHATNYRSVTAMIETECYAGLDRDEVYESFGEHIRETKRALLEMLIDIKRQDKTIVGYGAPAKGNTLLNYCGIGADFIDFVVDTTPAKQGMFLPGSRLPVMPPEALFAAEPDYVLILPWNFKKEIMDKLVRVRSWGGKFIVPIPRAEVI